MLLDDYSGPFEPDFDLTRLSRKALAVLGREWLLHGHLQDRIGMPLVLERHSPDDMTAVAIDEWMAVSPIYSRRTQRALDFADGDVPTIFKNIQLDIGAPPHFMDFRFEVRDKEHGEFFLRHCGALMDVEPMGEDFVRAMCHDIEDPTFDATAGATNPHAQVRPIHRPPRVPSDREPHCRWRVDIVADGPAVEPHPLELVLLESRIAHIPVDVPTTEAEPGGWTDYNRDLDPDFELEDLSHATLVMMLQEFAVQSHLLARGYLTVVAQRFGEDEALRCGARLFTGLAGLTAQRVRAAMGIAGDDAAAIAKVLQLHPVFWPRTYVDTTVEVLDDLRVRFAIRPCAALDEHDPFTWFATLGPGPHPALDALVQAVNPRAACRPAPPAAGEWLAWEAVIDPRAEPAREADEVALGKISTGATVTFTPRRPVRV